MFMLSGSQGPLFVSLTSWKRDHDVSMGIRSSVPRMVKIGVHFLVLFLDWFVFYFWLYFLLLVECSHYGCHPSMKVVPQFFPVAQNFLLRALRMF